MLTRLSVLIGVLAMVACSSASSDVGDLPSGATASSSNGAAGTGTVSEVLDFTAPSLEGGAITGADYAGKDLAIWFWAPW